MTPKKVFFTKGVGAHKDRLSSFEVALRSAGIEKCNLELWAFRLIRTRHGMSVSRFIQQAAIYSKLKTSASLQRAIKTVYGQQ